ncbi:MAG: hypothetical protein WCC36_08245 [Gammaproteobacteria bacterium]
MIKEFKEFAMRGINRLRRQQPAPDTKDCPSCFRAVPIKGVRCPRCTSTLDQG